MNMKQIEILREKYSNVTVTLETLGDIKENEYVLNIVYSGKILNKGLHVFEIELVSGGVIRIFVNNEETVYKALKERYNEKEIDFEEFYYLTNSEYVRKVKAIGNVGALHVELMNGDSFMVYYTLGE